MQQVSTLISRLPARLRPDLTPEEQERLTDYAVSTRYPGDYERIPLVEARQAVQIARRVRKHIRSLLPKAALRSLPNLDSNAETIFQHQWLPSVIKDLPEGSSLALLFDEFDVLADPSAQQAASAFFPYLRGLLTLDPKQLKFVFVIGRNVNDLSNIALSIFKGIPAHRVSLLDHDDTVQLVQLTETNHSLSWEAAAVERVWELTHGHTFLTQQLCSHVWERAYDDEPNTAPTIKPNRSLRLSPTLSTPVATP